MIALDIVRSWRCGWFMPSAISTKTVQHQFYHVTLPMMRRGNVGKDEQLHLSNEHSGSRKAEQTFRRAEYPLTSGIATQAGDFRSVRL